MLMLCLALAGCTPTAESQMDEQRNPHYLAGKEKLGALDYKGAIESFERAVEDNPRSALAHFELGVLFSAFTALIGMLALNGLPRHHHPLLKKERFLRVSDDRFIVCVEAADDKFDPEATRAMLASLGGTNIDLVEDE